jgi:Putative flagellar system-associated repeat
MKLRRKISLLVVGALAAATLALASASPALAAGRLSSTGNCGDLLDMRVRNVGDDIDVGITIPSIDSTEVWSITVIQQDYGAVTGGRIGNPVDVTSTFPPLVFSAANGGFAIDGGVVVNSPGLTHEISYTATRTAPSPQTCTNFGFWTNPGGASDGPVAGNPTTRPDAAPLYTGDSEADVGTNDALLLMDQEMQAGPAGIPAASRFTVSVNGVARTVSAVQILNDDPPNQAILDLTFGGLPIASTDTVTVRYTRPLVSSQAALQDLEALKTASFGPVTIAVV